LARLDILRDMTHRGHYVTWRIHMWDMTCSYVRHDSCIRETWLMHTWDMTHAYVRHDSFIRETWLIHTWDMTHSYVRHDWFIREIPSSTHIVHDSFTGECTWLLYRGVPFVFVAEITCVWRDPFTCGILFHRIGDMSPKVPDILLGWLHP